MSRTPRIMLASAAGCVVAFLLLLGLAYRVPGTRWLDAAALDGFASLARPRVSDLAQQLAHLCNPVPYSLAALTAIAVALVVRGLRTSAAVALLLVGANVSSQVLKPLLAYHRELYHTEWHAFNITDAAFPSGHATAAMSLSLAAMMIVPRAYRPLTAALGTLFTLAVTFSVMVLHWHFPSDVVGGFLIATAWGLVSLAALLYANERWPERGTIRVAAREALAAPSTAAIVRAAIALGVLIGAIVFVARAHQIAGFADRHTASVAVAGAVALCALALLAAVTALQGRRR